MNTANVYILYQEETAIIMQKLAFFEVSDGS